MPGMGTRAPRRPGGFFAGIRTMGTLAVVAVVAVAGIMLARAIGGIDISLFGTNQIDRSAPVVLKELRDVSRYTAATGEFQATIDIEDDVKFVPSFIAGERAIFIGVGSVDATVDFSGLTGDAVQVGSDGTVTVILPTPQLSKPALDPKRSHVANRDRGLVNRIQGMFTDNPTSERDLYLKAQRRLAGAAEGSTLEVRAERNTEKMLKGLLGNLGFERVVVLFDDGDGTPRAPSSV